MLNKNQEDNDIWKVINFSYLENENIIAINENSFLGGLLILVVSIEWENDS